MDVPASLRMAVDPRFACVYSDPIVFTYSANGVSLTYTADGDRATVTVVENDGRGGEPRTGELDEMAGYALRVADMADRITTSVTVD